MTAAFSAFNALPARNVEAILNAVLGSGWSVTNPAEQKDAGIALCTARRGNAGKVYEAPSLAGLILAVRADHPHFDRNLAAKRAAMRGAR